MRSSKSVSLVVAITGHRDLHAEDIPRYEAEIIGIFQELRKQYPHTPLLLLSGLAEGADRIAVRAATAESIPYLAVLPMPVHLYRQDFATEASDSEFEDLMRGALRCLELPLDPESGEEIARPGKARDRRYEMLGRFLVQYSQILIAIWDQDNVQSQGGTSHVVAMKLREETPSGPRAFTRMNTNGAGPVYVLPARRISSGPYTTPALCCEKRYPKSSTPGEYDASYRLLDRFNADISGASDDLAEALKQSRKYLFEGGEAIGLSGAMEWVASIYSSADALAIHFATVSLRLWNLVFVLLAISGAALTGLHLLHGGPKFLCAYYVCLCIALGVIWWEWRSKGRGRHEDYRALAEALRVQFFWMAAGIPDLAADQYLIKQAGEMVWIRDAIGECGLYDGVPGGSPGAVGDLPLRFRLAHNWVTGQAHYFLKTRRRHQAKKSALKVFALVAVAIGLAAPLVGLVQQAEAPSHAVAAIAMWWAALAWNYIERRGFAQEIRQYDRMHRLFRDADGDLEQFEKERNFRACEETIRDLGREALAENGDWLAIHRERKLSVEMIAG
jgi:hypothetical protein